MPLHRGPFCVSSYSDRVQRSFIAIGVKTLSFRQCGFAPSCTKAAVATVKGICIFHFLQKGSFPPSKDIVLVFYAQRGNYTKYHLLGKSPTQVASFGQAKKPSVNMDKPLVCLNSYRHTRINTWAKNVNLNQYSVFCIWPQVCIVV